MPASMRSVSRNTLRRNGLWLPTGVVARPPPWVAAIGSTNNMERRVDRRHEKGAGSLWLHGRHVDYRR